MGTSKTRRGRGTGFGSVHRDRGKWRARYTAPDGSKPSKTFPANAKTAAYDWLAAERTRITRGDWKPAHQIAAEAAERAQNAEAEAYTLGEWSEAWQDRLERLGRAPRTIQTHRYRLNAHIIPALGDTPLRTLTTGDVDRWHTKLADDHGNGVARPVYMTLSAMLNAAVKAGHIDTSPAQVEGGTRHRPVRDRERRQVATPSEVRALAEAMPARLAAAIHLAAWCQLRQGEILGLRKHDVDLEAGVLSVRRQAQWLTGEAEPREDPPKSEAGTRDLSMPAALVPILRAHMKDHAGRGPQGLVITNGLDQSKHLHPNTFRNAWNAARDAVGMPWFVFHDLRHTGLTEFAKAGATNAELLHRGGHRSLEVALRYQHWTMQRDRQLSASLSRLIDPEAEPAPVAGVVELSEARAKAAGS